AVACLLPSPRIGRGAGGEGRVHSTCGYTAARTFGDKRRRGCMAGSDASTALKERVRAKIAELMPELGDLSDDIFAHPEIRFEEHHASAAISDVLRRHEIEVDNGVAGLPTAFVA